MKRVFAALLAFSMFVAYQPLPITALAQNTGEIAGTAVVEGKPLPNITVRLRNVDNGQLVGSQRTNERGEFRFTGLPVGNFVVETVSDDGTLLGTSARIALVAGAMIATGVSVSTSAAAAAAAGVGAGAAAGAAGAAAGAGAGAAAGAAAAGGAFFATTAGIVTVAAVGAGVAAAAVAATGEASPSR
jgi:hypothetical protein